MENRAAEIVTELKSRDEHRVWQAMYEVINAYDLALLQDIAQHRAAIMEANKNVDLGGALRPNRVAFDFAMRKLEHLARGEGCLCALYLDYDLCDPAKLAKAGQVKVIEETLQDGAVQFQCQCNTCQSHYKVEQFDYHYPWWNWHRA